MADTIKAKWSVLEAQKILYDRYREVATQYSDIYEHVPVLLEYASNATSILEAGVRSGVSSYPLLTGLYTKLQMRNLQNSKTDDDDLLEVKDSSAAPVLVSVDMQDCPNVPFIGDLAKALGINFTFWKGNDLLYPVDVLPQKFDIVFIDTWHVYGQCKRELEKFAPMCSQYFILHDTEVDKLTGESVRCHFDILKQHEQTGFPINEIVTGLWPAILDFLKEHPEFKLEKCLTNNNGLTILKRV